jgi:heat shock protein HtpX
VKNRDTLIPAIGCPTITGVITYLAICSVELIFGGRDDEGGNIVGVLATAILNPITALIIPMAISRNREFGADVTDAKISGKPMEPANALICS